MAEARFARIGVWEGTPDELDRWADQCARVKAGVVSQPGGCGAFFLLDREAGRALTLTLWESEEARAASESFRAQSQDTTSDRSGAQATTERYEVVDWFRIVEPGPGEVLSARHGSARVVEVAPPVRPEADRHPAGYRPARSLVVID
jgi:heme-degrading monooxygenase HmoA